MNEKRSVDYHKGLIERLKNPAYFDHFIKEIEKEGFKKAIDMLRKYKDDDGFAQAPFWADWLEEQIK